MTEIQPWPSQGGPRDRRGQAVYRETAVTLLMAKGATQYAQRAMELLTEVDQDRRALAGDNQALNALLVEQELILAHKLACLGRRLYERY
jgi:hypothetical protein